MRLERQSDELGRLQVSKPEPTEPPLHALHPASSWQPPLLEHSFSSLQPTELATRKYLKRSRPQEDIDRFGEGISRKKRRLRHELVTSRLSRPYATPATHIARGAWRLGVWARQRLSGGLLFRKGAILNSIAKKKKGSVLESTKKTKLADVAPKYGNACCAEFPLANIVRLQSDPSYSLPLQSSSKSRSVFASSDYDAFDYEESEPIEDEEDERDEEENASDDTSVYSDFRVLNSSDSDEEFGDASYSFDTLDASYQLGEKALHLVMENESKNEVSVAPETPETLNSFLSGHDAVGL